MNNLQSNLRECRLNEEKKQRDIAEYLNITQSTYSKWEQGISEPSSQQLVKLADFYNVTTDFLLGRQNYGTDLIEVKNELAPAESELMEYFRKLNRDYQQRVIGFAIALAQ